MRILGFSPYNDEWPAQYEMEEKRVRKVLGENLAEIYHIDSTSVPGMKAKSTIDILASVKCLREAAESSARFRGIGYEYLGENGIAGRLLFVLKEDCGNGDWINRFHLHIYSRKDSDGIERHIAVRDYLRSHSDEAERYSTFKEKLAAEHANDAERYVSGKEEYVASLERRARMWRLGLA